MNNNFTIGVLGGMGTYATIHLFHQYAELFAAEKEWERPRIIIDNRCTMPSRVRALLYNENVDKLIKEMADSLQGLKNSGCNRIILACNTSHLFLPSVYKIIDGLSDLVVNIIDVCVDKISADGNEEVYLIGSEATIDSRIYQDKLEARGITCVVPEKDEYGIIRDCIEAVKQNRYTEDIRNTFLNLVNRHDRCILGCTELPILYKMYGDETKLDAVYDPLFIALCELRKEFENAKNSNVWSV